MRWRCVSCGNVHRGNERTCAACGHTVMRPSSATTSAGPPSLLWRLLVVAAIAALTIAVTISGAWMLGVPMP